MMQPIIQQRWQQLSDPKDDMWLLIDSIAAENMQRPEPDNWSATQVIEHLLASEGGTLGYMLKKSSGGWDTLENADKAHHENSRSINERLRSDERYKAPDVLPVPPNASSKEELMNQWNALREKLENFIDTIEVQHLDKLVFRQPAAGMLNIVHTLEFMEAHLRHHLPQVQRILASHID